MDGVTPNQRLEAKDWPNMHRVGDEVQQVFALPRPATPALPALRTTQNACYEALSLALKEGHVFAALTGPGGAGKTTVLEAVLADRQNRAIRCIRIADPDKVPASLAVRIERVAYAEAGKAENLERHVVIVVDDAHTASNELLLCLSRLGAIREPGRRVPQVLLVGRPELWDRLADDDFAPLARRLAIRAALPSPEDDTDPWASVEDEITQTMTRLRAEAEHLPALRETYGRPDSTYDFERRFEPEHGFDNGPEEPHDTSDHAVVGEVPPPSMFALFPDPPPKAPHSAARETRRRLVMPLVSLFVGLAAFAFALSFYDWPDLLGDMPWSTPKNTAIKPFVMTTSPQAQTFGLPAPPPLADAAAGPPPAAPNRTASSQPTPANPKPSGALPTAGSPVTAPPVTAPPVTAPPVTATPAQPRAVASTAPTEKPAQPALPRAETPAPAAPPIDASPPVLASAPVSSAPIASPPPSPSPAPSAAEEAPAPPVPPPAAVSKASVAPPPARARAPAKTEQVSPAVMALLLKRGNEQVAIGDIFAARLLFERAAESGSAVGARQMARTFDPADLPPVSSGLADLGHAKDWYERGAALGDAESAARLKELKLKQGR
ncbi:MAG: hypothetical protein RQ966_05220 [Acetobacteraceae bacterium]|nr:hypothetical protein [Acetobacteraceae bacterium]